MKSKSITILADGALVTIRGTPAAVARIEADIRAAAVQRFIERESAGAGVAERIKIIDRARKMESLLAS